MTQLNELPELRAIDGGDSLIRIPNQLDVPVTSRVRRLIDTPQFQRLGGVGQLGLVRFVYPGATHSRLEHSLGVYRNAVLFLRQLGRQPRFQAVVSRRGAEKLLVAALLHDLGHWPFCHLMEDLQLEGIPSHESFARNYLQSDPLHALLERDWAVTGEEISELLHGRGQDPETRMLQSILSGPIDIDKMDYLYRDSLHAGVPYGQNFDSLRLIGSLCPNEAGDALAINRKGRTAAELMVFARYVMFSEVYWHHTVRSATAMLQRAFFRWHQQARQQPDFPEQVRRLLRANEPDLVRQLNAALPEGASRPLLEGLFGQQRALYKRLGNYALQDAPELYSRIAQKPYPWLVACAAALAQGLADRWGLEVDPEEVLVDAPPMGLEVQFDVDVLDPVTGSYCRLGDVSPVVQTLARRQFDDFVKQVRIFVAPRLAGQQLPPEALAQLLQAASDQADAAQPGP